MLKQFQAEIQKLNLITHHKIGLAISGGVDSVVLLQLLLDSELKNIILLHVNYGLRGKESDEDEAFVRNLAITYNLQIEILDAKNQFNKHTGIQEKARQIRYDWFNTFINNNSIDIVLTAHQQNDLSETLLLNLFRKTGIDGLTGMGNRQRFLRPLLPFSRKQIEDFAEEKGLQWRNDSSNMKSDYARNFIRNKIIPLTEEKFPNVIQNIAETALQIRQEKDLLQSLTTRIARDLWIRQDEQLNIISRTHLVGFNQASLLLHYLLEDKGFNYVQANEMCLSKDSGKEWESELYRACTSDDKIWIIPKSLHTQEHSFRWIIGKEIQLDWGIMHVSTKQLPSNSYTLYLGESLVGKEIEMRFWELGDKIQMANNGQSKKLSDLFTEHKIPVLLRKLIPVFLIENQIVWIPGIRTAPGMNNPQNNHSNLLISAKHLLL
ncbi:MAG: tRNA lysidine(34) synthetase TilS [Bacteroidia bacterium]|nr:tRNA lysidine(34) synthetase TilS [Bacteroidia bacterium]